MLGGARGGQHQSGVGRWLCSFALPGMSSGRRPVSTPEASLTGALPRSNSGSGSNPSGGPSLSKVVRVTSEASELTAPSYNTTSSPDKPPPNTVGRPRNDSKVSGGSQASPIMSDMHQKAANVSAGFKTPSAWVLIFGWSLAVCAGFVNTVGYRSWGYFVSHVTGTTSAIGMRIEGFWEGRHEYVELENTICLLVAFLSGAYACGFLIDKNQVHFGGKNFYGMALVANSVLLCAAVSTTDAMHAAHAEEAGNLPSAVLAAIACGLQNAMCTSHFGAVVRTTHVTGTITDIGSTLGRMSMMLVRRGYNRRKSNVVEMAEMGVDCRKVIVLIPMWFSYLFGCVFGAYMQTLLGVNALLFPAGITFTVGMLYTVFRNTIKEGLKAFERERLSYRLQEMKDNMWRANERLQRFQEIKKTKSTDQLDRKESKMVIELEADFAEMCHAMNNFQEELEGIYESETSGEDGTPRRSDSRRSFPSGFGKI